MSNNLPEKICVNKLEKQLYLESTQDIIFNFYHLKQ